MVAHRVCGPLRRRLVATFVGAAQVLHIYRRLTTPYPETQFCKIAHGRDAEGNEGDVHP